MRFPGLKLSHQGLLLIAWHVGGCVGLGVGLGVASCVGCGLGVALEAVVALTVGCTVVACVDVLAARTGTDVAVGVDVVVDVLPCPLKILATRPIKAITRITAQRPPRLFFFVFGVCRIKPPFLHDVDNLYIT